MAEAGLSANQNRKEGTEYMKICYVSKNFRPEALSIIEQAADLLLLKLAEIEP